MDMDIVTADTITPAEILILRGEAINEGDTALVSTCWEALAEWPAALARVADAVNARRVLPAVAG